jgi:MGT family glycosyltransferase
VGLPADGDGEARRGPLLSVVPPALDDGPAHRFRDVPPPPAPPLPARWEDDGRPLVYLTFGSVTGSLPFFPGLYRAALDALAPLPVRILLTIGRDADLDALGPPPPNAHVEAWVDQDAVLSHAAVVVSHGGYGTTLGAFAHGVPLVLLPLFAGDQWRNARRVAELGAGVILEHGERRVFDPPGPAVLAELPAAVQHVLGDRRFAQAADRIGRSMATLPTADATVAVLRATAAPGGLAR